MSEKPIKVGLVNLGCPKNQVDAEMMLDKLANAGFQLETEPGLADVVIINTCGFITSAKEEAIENIDEFLTLKKEGRIKKVVVTGCLAERYLDDIAENMPDADVIVSFLPSSDKTRGLVDARFLSRCKRGAYFANGGRGDLVVQPDLIAALESGQLAGAALDVTTPEPLPADDPLWDAPNIFITPHVAGQFHLPVVLTNIARITAENLHHLAAGEPLRNDVPLSR